MTRALAIFTLLIFLVLATYVFISMRPVALPKALDPVANWFDERRSAPGDNTAPARAPEPTAPTAPTVENLAARSAVAEVSVNDAGEVSVKPGSARTSAAPAIASARNAEPGTGPVSKAPAAATTAATTRPTTAPAVVASADSQATAPAESAVNASSATVAASEPASANRPAGVTRAQAGSERQVTTAAAAQVSRPAASARVVPGIDATPRMATAAASTDGRLAESGQGRRTDQASNQAGQTDNTVRASDTNKIVAQGAVRTAPAEANAQRGARQLASRSNAGAQGLAPLAAVSPAPDSPAPKSPASASDSAATIGSATTRVLGQTEEAPGAGQVPGNETPTAPITTGSTPTLRQNAADATNALVARSVTTPAAARAETPGQLAMAQPTREEQALSAPSVRASVSTDAGLISPETRTPPPRTEQAVEQQQTIVNFLEGKVVEFEVGRDRLTTAGVKVLDRLVPLIQAHENTVITVQGHTDDVGDARSNLELSAARAVVARRYLISRGVDPRRLRAQGLGESQPLTTNLTAAGRIRNRRIDFAVSDIRDTP